MPSAYPVYIVMILAALTRPCILRAQEQQAPEDHPKTQTLLKQLNSSSFMVRKNAIELLGDRCVRVWKQLEKKANEKDPAASHAAKKVMAKLTHKRLKKLLADDRISLPKKRAACRTEARAYARQTDRVSGKPPEDKSWALLREQRTKYAIAQMALDLIETRILQMEFILSQRPTAILYNPQTPLDWRPERIPLELRLQLPLSIQQNSQTWAETLIFIGQANGLSIQYEDAKSKMRASKMSTQGERVTGPILEILPFLEPAGTRIKLDRKKEALHVSSSTLPTQAFVEQGN